MWLGLGVECVIWLEYSNPIVPHALTREPNHGWVGVPVARLEPRIVPRGDDKCGKALERFVFFHASSRCPPE